MRSTDRANPYKHITSGRRPRMCVWPSWLQKDLQRICILRVHCLGGWNETHIRNPNLCYLLCCLVPCQVHGTPVLCIPASAASPCVRACFVFRNVCFYLYDYCYYFWPSISALSRNSCVVPAPPAGHRKNLFGFSSSVSLLSFRFFFFFLPSVWSYSALFLFVHHLNT